MVCLYKHTITNPNEWERVWGDVGMIYTIQLDLDIDEEGIMEDSTVVRVIKDMMDSSAITIRNVNVVDVND